MCAFIDISNLRKLLNESIKEDIKEFGKPALIYNFHHKKHVLNTMDTVNQWKKEKEIMKSHGLTLRPVKKEIDIDGDIWESILWIYQPLIKEGVVDEKKYLK